MTDYYKNIFENIYDNYGFGGDESRSGGGSTLENTEHIRAGIKKLIKLYDIKSVVDVPCGDFNWMKEIVFSFQSYTGGDIVPRCIKENNENFGCGRIKFVELDVLKDEIPAADLLLVRDIIGHFPIDDGYKAVQNIVKSKCKYILSTTWYNKLDSTFNKNYVNKGAHEFGKFYPVNLMSEPFNFPEPETVIEEGFRVDDYDKGNRKVLALWDLNKVREHLSKLPSPRLKPVVESKDLTIVTGLWNIGRPGRDFTHYLENFDKFLQMPYHMFIYVPKELEKFVWERRSSKNTHVRVFELSDVKQLYSPFWDKTQEIRNNPDWYNQTGENGWLKGSPQASLEWYNPIVQSKMFMLNDARILNPFDTEYLIWLDAGITNTVYEKYFSENKCFDKIIPYLSSFLFLSYPYDTKTEIHGFKKSAIDRYANADLKYVCRGGLFGGHRDFIGQANATYYSTLHNTLNEGLMGTEESIFSIMASMEPHIYRRYELDSNGLIVKFVQALLEDKVTLADVATGKYRVPKGVYNEKTSKTSLYMLTFNFPQQVEHTIKTWKNHSSDWLEKPRKILIDNSTDLDARIANKELANKYGFEHIIMGKNGGINGGRQFAAEHFHDSDSDYYFFFEDDMGLYGPEYASEFCRNGFRHYIPDLYKKAHQVIAREEFDFLKLSYTEVYMDNNIQVSWYNVPQIIRTNVWPDYDRLPITGLDVNAPRTKFDRIEVLDGLSYISGEIYYANWPMIVGKAGNKKMFIDTKWANPYEQTWMSYMFQETLKRNLNPACLLASPIHHNRIVYYKPEERREN